MPPRPPARPLRPSFLERAIEIAEQGMQAGRGGPFGALVVRGDEVLAEASNRVTTSADPTAHAEIVAIRAACQRIGNFSLAGCEIYSSCEPCPMCLAAVYWARIDSLYFAASRSDAAAIGFDDAFLYDELRRAPDARSLPAEQALRERAAHMMLAWRDLPKDRHY
ncbi:MAG TPA: nucleoside deaminase [Polyangiaceae bacterium]|nr:nucleoside deaminase [Polyangiaceae bacterium]